MSAGSYRLGRIVCQRAWRCPVHRCRWYDSGIVCRVCGSPGEPEALPPGATLIDQPAVDGDYTAARNEKSPATGPARASGGEARAAGSARNGAVEDGTE